MPQTDGLVTCKELKKRYLSMRIIAYAMDGRKRMIKLMATAGCDRYLFKGFEVGDLLGTMSALATHKAALK